MRLHQASSWVQEAVFRRSAQKKIVESVKRGISKSETARRFGIDRSTLRRYLNQLDEEGSLSPKKAPGKPSKLSEIALGLLEQDLRERPWATHRQRSEFFSMGSVGLR
jgi:transposase